MKINKNQILLSITIISYICLNIIYLDKFPFVHSDEPWLSGLSKNMLENTSLSVTEPFFDLMPRYPHALKVVFHLIQIPFIYFLGYNIFSVRLISLIFGLLTLFIFYILLKKLTNKTLISYLGTLLLAVDIQFIYASHFARQEILLLFIFLVSLYILFICRFNITLTPYRNQNLNKLFNKLSVFTIKSEPLLIGSLIGVSIGIHPNSFIIFLPIFLIYSFEFFYNKPKKDYKIFIFLTTVSFFAASFVLISFYFDSDFVAHYFSYGKSFKVDSSIVGKIKGFAKFYKDIIERNGKTYYIPNLDFQFVFFITTFILSLIELVKNHINNKKAEFTCLLYIILSIASLNLGAMIIGRFNQTSIIFQFPLYYILAVLLIRNLSSKAQNLVLISIIIISSYFSYINIMPYKNLEYNSYLKVLNAIPSDSVVLSNLNTHYYFQSSNFYDYRNLPYLEENNLSIKEYIEKNKIEYIVITEDLSFFYNNKPHYNGVYGNIDFYPDLEVFLAQRCSIISKSKSRLYPMHMVKFTGLYEEYKSMAVKDYWDITIYKVNYPIN